MGLLNCPPTKPHCNTKIRKRDDMTETNKAIEREGHDTSTLDEILCDLDMGLVIVYF